MTEQHPHAPQGGHDLTKAPDAPAQQPVADASWAPPTGPAAPAQARPRRSAGVWVGLVALGTLACLVGWWLSPFASRLGFVDSVGPDTLLFGLTPTSYGLASGVYLAILVLGVSAAALVTRRAAAAVVAVALASLLGTIGWFVSAAVQAGPGRLGPVLVGLVLTLVMTVPVAALAGLLCRWPWGRLLVVAAGVAPPLLFAVQQLVVAVAGPAGYSRTANLVLLGLAVLLVAAVAVGGGRGGWGTAAARLPVGAVVLLVAGSLLPFLGLALATGFGVALPTDLGGGNRMPRLSVDMVLTPYRSLPATWPAWVGGTVLGALLGVLVRLVRRSSSRGRHDVVPAASAPA